MSSLLCISSLLAHQDDSGDIDPWIHIEDAQFAVTFRNTTENQVYKTVISAHGDFISSRQKSKRPVFSGPPVVLPEEQQGITVSLADEFYVFPQFERKHGGRPFMLKVVEENFKNIPLFKDDTFVSIVHGAAVSDDVIVLTTSSKRPVENPGEWPFTFNSFDPNSFDILHTTNIGVPKRIYSFAQDSNVLIHQRYAYVAWMAWDGTAYSLNLSRYNPFSGECKTREITEGWGNSSPSISIIDDNILITFHKVFVSIENGDVSYHAKVVYEHHNLIDIFNK